MAHDHSLLHEFGGTLLSGCNLKLMHLYSHYKRVIELVDNAFTVARVTL